MRSVAQPFTYVLWFFVAHGASVLVTAPGIRGMAVVREARRQWKLGVGVAALSIITYGSAMLAYRFGATAQLAALRETSVLFGTALAMTFPRRTHDTAPLDRRGRHRRAARSCCRWGDAGS